MERNTIEVKDVLCPNCKCSFGLFVHGLIEGELKLKNEATSCWYVPGSRKDFPPEIRKEGRDTWGLKWPKSLWRDGGLCYGVHIVRRRTDPLRKGDEGLLDGKIKVWMKDPDYFECAMLVFQKEDVNRAYQDVDYVSVKVGSSRFTLTEPVWDGKEE